MEFIENNEKYGIKYDLSKIAKEYKKLKIPKEFDFWKLWDWRGCIKWNL